MQASDTRARLADMLTKALDDVMAVARKLEPEAVVEGRWRVKDVIGHLAAEDVEAVQSLKAYNAGSEHQIANFDNEVFNQQQYEKRKDMPAEAIYSEWATARADLKTALSQTPEDKLDGSMLYPWAERGTVTYFIQDIVGHDGEHRDSLLKIVER